MQREKHESAGEGHEGDRERSSSEHGRAKVEEPRQTRPLAYQDVRRVPTTKGRT
jgi:hypothetical protein